MMTCTMLSDAALSDGVWLQDPLIHQLLSSSQRLLLLAVYLCIAIDDKICKSVGTACLTLCDGVMFVSACLRRMFEF